MEHAPIILLPSHIRLLRPRPRQSIVMDIEEYTIYFKNLVYPYDPTWDIQTVCDYGANFGEFWRLSEYPYDIDEFPLTVRVYDAWGSKLAEKTATVTLHTKLPNQKEYRLLCIGDSMTHTAFYVAHLADKLSNVKAIGLRSDNGAHAHEGRGGWTLCEYLDGHADRWNGPSPFIFPKNVSGKEYFGDLSFEERIRTPELDTYSLDGYRVRELKTGQVYHKDEKLYRHTENGDTLIDASPEWEFSFGKYLERLEQGTPDAVSILLGANDLQCRPYEESEAYVAWFIRNFETLIGHIRSFSETMDIIINLPVTGADQYAWGIRGPRSGGAKMYRYNIVMACREILNRWDGKENGHIFISPMLLTLDPVYGFDRRSDPANIYCDAQIGHHCNWVHPNRSGYYQMADALAGVVRYLQMKK